MSLEDSSPRSEAANAATRPRRIWTPAEDAILKALVSHYGDARGPQSRWKDIAAGLQDRTAKDCRKRWFHSLDPSLRKGRWTPQEDQVLLSAYNRLGPAWHDIAVLIPGRKDDQCAKRYNDILNPQAKDRLSHWSPLEDDILREGVQTLGHRWSAISAKLPGRPPLTCRNRWRALSRHSKGSPSTSTPSSTACQMSASENGISPETQDLATPSAGIDTEMPNQLDLGNLSTAMMDTNTSLADDAMNFVSDPGHFPEISTQSHITGHNDANTLGIIEDTEATQRQSYQGVSSDSSDCASTPPRSGWDTTPEVPLAGRQLGSRGAATRSRPMRPPQSSNSISQQTYSDTPPRHSKSCITITTTTTITIITITTIINRSLVPLDNSNNKLKHSQ
ncbi:Myb-like DNA-binding protein BAS1 [Colletotrichum siamense]|uniref:Myb-like DNA-binding protein BAS1 n=1 Tax=Colletotrichum siamense TaxID=690259 RepID=UPI001872D593|nr:Myb-like DNA-binding protein BAS1 [Colletotrichum siamense]KAF5506288.1 Myb-like DNA-binding protein BAS1 [Colletotrichum siamense]